MPRILAFVIVLCVLIASCEPSVDDLPSVSPGRIVVATSDGSIAVHSADGEEMVRIDPPAGSVYRQPTWLDAASIIYSEVSESGEHSLTASDATSGEVVWRAEFETAPFYYSPAPSGSLFATTSLRNNPSGTGLIAELVDSNGEVEGLSSDAPFYTAWKPDGSQLAIHITGDRLDVAGGENLHTILSPTGLFQSPAWTNRGLVTLRTIADVQTLSVWKDDQFSDVATLDGPAAFVVSGDRVAVQAVQLNDPNGVQAGLRVQEVDPLTSGRLFIVHINTSEVEAVTDGRSIVYQWDQSGERLLYAMASEKTDNTLEWFVRVDETDSEVAEFVPQGDWIASFVPFFDQYAQSVNIWSPSGDRIAYPAMREGKRSVIVSSIAGEGDISIPDAVWASWEPTPR